LGQWVTLLSPVDGTTVATPGQWKRAFDAGPGLVVVEGAGQWGLAKLSEEGQMSVLWKKNKRTFAVYDAVGNGHEVVVNEVGASLRSYSCTGDQLWDCDLGDEEANALGWNDDLQVWVILSRSGAWIVGRGGKPQQLGDRPPGTLLRDGRLIVGFDGSVFRIPDLTCVAQVDPTAGLLDASG
jgi:hypothetical protein